MAGTTVFRNGRIFSAEDALATTADFLECLVVKDDKIAYVGSENDEKVKSAEASGAEVIDLSGQVVVPAFIDSHMHLLQFGLGLAKLNLSECKSFEDIKAAVSNYAKAHPEMSRILCRQWHQSATNGKALASMLDDIDPRPIYIEARDCHSTWCNSAALEELRERLEATADLYGEDIHRDDAGRPSGLVAEGAHLGMVWPFLTGACSMSERLTALNNAIDVYIESGYAGIVEMAMENNAWDALQLLRSQQDIPIHIAAHWAVPYSKDEQQIEEHLNEAIAKHREFHPSKSPELCIIGIKLFNDGAIGGCTAALSHPYMGYTNLVDPIWPADVLKRTVKKAVDAGLQVAIHAIGDVAISQTIDAIAAANHPQGRQRVEHLQLASAEDVKRVGQLGITASIQGVHMDPVVSTAYSRIVKPHLWEQAFAFRDFLDHGACVALGSDTPTARHLPLPNLYNVTTRRSAVRPELPDVVHEHYALTLSQAIAAQTSQAAYSRFAESWTGSLTAGKLANFLVMDMVWSAEKLLEAKVSQTWIKGQKRFQNTT